MTVQTRPGRPFKRIALGVGLALVVVVAFTQRGRLDLATLLHLRDQWRAWDMANPVLGAGAFFVLYVTLAALSVPVGGAMTMLSGALFGFGLGALLASFASTTGAVLALLAARTIFRDAVRRRFGDRLATIEANGVSALFSLRLIPVVPFFLVNLAMALTSIPVLTFALVSQLGMLPATLLYANAGRQLDAVRSLGDILTPRILAGFLALAALPVAVKLGRSWWSGRAARGRWPRPRQVDYNLIVIGAGSAGLVSAQLAAAAGARVALIESGSMGGDCLNTGCVPSKALIRSAKLAHEAGRPDLFGLTGRLDADFRAIMARVRRVTARIAPHDSAARYQGLGVDVIAGEARVTDPWTVAVNGRTLRARRLLIATGAVPTMPDIPGLAATVPLTSDTLWSLADQPGRLLILGGGAIGCEMAQAFARIGTRVTLVESAPRLIPSEDVEACAAMLGLLEADGVEVLLESSVIRVAQVGGAAVAHLADGRARAVDRVLVAIGKTPRTTGFGLEELGLLEDGRLVVDDRLRTRLPSIYAAGDVIGRLQFTHAASHYAWFAAMNALFGGLRSSAVRTRAFPRVTYTDPEIARVGLTPAEAQAAGTRFEITRFDLADFDRAIVDEAATGFVKVLSVPGKDRILGVTIVGARAGDILGEFTLAMSNNLGLDAVLRTIHPYPGWTEAARSVAGAWRREHLPAWLRALARAYLRRTLR